MFDKFFNIFRIPDLRNRVLFTAALLAVYRLGSQLPTPGVNWQPAAAYDFRPRHHAVHYGLHHSPVADRGL
jgi:preprotein translocase subunit SecY